MRMSNIQVLEKDVIISELMLGYVLYKEKEKLIIEKETCFKEIEKIKKGMQKDVEVENIKYYKNKYKKYVQLADKEYVTQKFYDDTMDLFDKLDKYKNRLKKELLPKKVVTIILLILIPAFLLSLFFLYCDLLENITLFSKNVNDWILFFSYPTAIISVFAIPILFLFLKCYNEEKEEIEHIKMLIRGTSAKISEVCTLPTRDEFVKQFKLDPHKCIKRDGNFAYKKNIKSYSEFLKSEDKSLEIVQKNSPAHKKIFDSLMSTLNEKKEHQVQISKEILKINNELASIRTKIKAIPVYYFQNPDAIKKMLFLMINKRADTIKELVNLYEETEWQSSLLKSVSNVSLQIGTLKNDLMVNFKILSTELGIINRNVSDINSNILDLKSELININSNSNKIVDVNKDITKQLMRIEDTNTKQYYLICNELQKYAI